jgi:hypothetical protein
MIKNPAEYERDNSSAKITAIYCQVSPASLLGVPASVCQRALVEKSGISRTQMGNAQ